MQGSLQIRNGMVVSPPLAEDQKLSLQRAMSDAEPGTEAGDFLVLARLMVEVLSTRPLARMWPAIALGARRRSLWRAAILAADDIEIPVLARAEDDMVLAACNVARWLLGIPQQPSLLPVVFVSAEDVSADDVEIPN